MLSEVNQTKEVNVSKSCNVPGCSNPRKVNRSGNELTMCDAHNREYWRRQKSGDWDGWAGNKPGKRGGKQIKRQAPAPTLPAPERPANIRVLALRCALCGVKKPYTADYFDVTAYRDICRNCDAGEPVTVLDPLTNTARHGRLTISSEVVQFDETPEAYAAFARSEQRAGNRVVVAW